MMSHDDMMDCIATEAHEACCVVTIRERETLKKAIKRRCYNFTVHLRNLWHWRTAWAVRHLSKQLQRDKALRDSWHANIAMPIYDATRPVTDDEFERFQQTSEKLEWVKRMPSTQANFIAERLLQHLFGV